ncbi:odorant receptor 30a-like isoform X2 [Cylas formicarius]|uniref:odorant receptor 30a-like isoform X2 n=1 Tax=Cylas formicarius TaxID=197179 RepID=UPI002958B0CF|nr:odorant receptor 30a-like isoform X2 [Cylas formicarius]
MHSKFRLALYNLMIITMRNDLPPFVENLESLFGETYTFTQRATPLMINPQVIYKGGEFHTPSIMKIDYFKHVRRLMMVIGIWKVESPDDSVFRKRIYQVYSVSFQLLCYSVAFSILAEIPSLAKSEVMASMDNGNRFTVFMVIIIKMIAWQSKRMVYLLGIMLEQHAHIQAASLADFAIRRLYQHHVRYNHKFVFVLVFSAVIISVTISAVGMTTSYRFINSPENGNITEKEQPVRSEYPFDTQNHNTLALVDQNLRPMIGCFCIGVTTASLNSPAIFVRLQLKVLQHYFGHLHQPPEEALDSLRLLCVRHQLLIECTIEFSKSSKHIVLLDYRVSSVTFAVPIIQTMSSFLIQGKELTVTILTLTILQLITFAWNCNEIIVQSTELGTALYKSEWYD